MHAYQTILPHIYVLSLEDRDFPSTPSLGTVMDFVGLENLFFQGTENHGIIPE